MRLPRVSTLASLWARALKALNVSGHSAARTPGTLQATIAEPTPTPSIMSPSRTRPRCTSRATA